MNKPYIICHMMTSVDGRIDCAMTEHLPGVQEYYETLDELNAPSRVSGRVRMSAVFDGLGMDRPVTPLTLTDVRKFSSGAVWLRYSANS